MAPKADKGVKPTMEELQQVHQFTPLKDTETESELPAVQPGPVAQLWTADMKRGKSGKVIMDGAGPHYLAEDEELTLLRNTVVPWYDEQPPWLKPRGRWDDTLENIESSDDIPQPVFEGVKGAMRPDKQDLFDFLVDLQQKKEASTFSIGASLQAIVNGLEDIIAPFDLPIQVNCLKGFVPKPKPQKEWTANELASTPLDEDLISGFVPLMAGNPAGFIRHGWKRRFQAGYIYWTGATNKHIGHFGAFIWDRVRGNLMVFDSMASSDARLRGFLSVWKQALRAANMPYDFTFWAVPVATQAHEWECGYLATFWLWTTLRGLVGMAPSDAAEHTERMAQEGKIEPTAPTFALPHRDWSAMPLLDGKHWNPTARKKTALRYIAQHLTHLAANELGIMHSGMVNLDVQYPWDFRPLHRILSNEQTFIRKGDLFTSFGGFAWLPGLPQFCHEYWGLTRCFNPPSAEAQGELIRLSLRLLTPLNRWHLRVGPAPNVLQLPQLSPQAELQKRARLEARNTSGDLAQAALDQHESVSADTRMKKSLKVYNRSAFRLARKDCIIPDSDDDAGVDNTTQDIASLPPSAASSGLLSNKVPQTPRSGVRHASHSSASLGTPAVAREQVCPDSDEDQEMDDIMQEFASPARSAAGSGMFINSNSCSPMSGVSYTFQASGSSSHSEKTGQDIETTEEPTTPTPPKGKGKQLAVAEKPIIKLHPTKEHNSQVPTKTFGYRQLQLLFGALDKQRLPDSLFPRITGVNFKATSSDFGPRVSAGYASNVGKAGELMTSHIAATLEDIIEPRTRIAFLPRSATFMSLVPPGLVDRRAWTDIHERVQEHSSAGAAPSTRISEPEARAQRRRKRQGEEAEERGKPGTAGLTKELKRLGVVIDGERESTQQGRTRLQRRK